MPHDVNQPPNDDQLVIYASRWQNVVSAMAKAVAVPAFIWLATISFPSNSTFALICGIAALFLGLNCIMQLRQVLDRQPVLILTNHALLDRRSGTCIPWSRVREVTLVEETLNQIVEHRLAFKVQTEDGQSLSQAVVVDLLESEPAEVWKLASQHVEHHGRAA